MAKKKGDNSALTGADVKMTGELEKPVRTAEPTRQAEISYAVFCLKKKKKHESTNVVSSTPVHN